MPIARTADLVAAAHRAGSGLLAFNVITLEHAEAIVAGAEAAGKPVILQISENAVQFHHGAAGPIAAAAPARRRRVAAVAVAVHLDHVEDDALLHAAARTRPRSAMFDASTLTYDANVAATAAAAQWAHAHGLFAGGRTRRGRRQGRRPRARRAHRPRRGGGVRRRDRRRRAGRRGRQLPRDDRLAPPRSTTS